MVNRFCDYFLIRVLNKFRVNQARPYRTVHVTGKFGQILRRYSISKYLSRNKLKPW
jgi:hypothetical protein